MNAQATVQPTTTDAPLRIALLGNPNCGKTALFNLLTGARQKVANYAGVTVERKEGLLQTAAGRRVWSPAPRAGCAWRCWATPTAARPPCSTC